MTVQAEQRIKVAVQKSGRLTDNSLHLMETCGLIYSRGRDQLICFGENMPVDVLLVRDDDIPALVAEGICDLGIVGMNVFREKVTEDMDVRPELELDFGRCRLSIAVPRGFENELLHHGATVLEHRIFADHHRYSAQEILEIHRRAAELGAEMIVTTEKDAVRIPRLEEDGVPLYFLRVEIEMFSGQEQFDEWIRRICLE